MHSQQRHATSLATKCQVVFVFNEMSPNRPQKESASPTLLSPPQLPLPHSSAACPSPLPPSLRLCLIAKISINAIQSCRAAANPIKTKIQIKYVQCRPSYCFSTSAYPVDSGRVVRNCVYSLQGILSSITLLSTLLSLPPCLSLFLCRIATKPQSCLFTGYVCVAKLWLALSRSRVKSLLDKRAVGG